MRAMISGDLVRFKSVTWPYNMDGQWRIGLLVKYEKLEKMGTVLYEGRLLRIRAAQMEKAGVKDESR